MVALVAESEFAAMCSTEIPSISPKSKRDRYCLDGTGMVDESPRAMLWDERSVGSVYCRCGENQKSSCDLLLGWDLDLMLCTICGDEACKY